MSFSATNIIAHAKKTIEVEIETLRNLVFDDHFVAVVQLIARSRGRVVLTGIGKSAIVAQKIVATLNSTGTPSVFMHAADAIHGDLGIIQPEDTVICISKSGDTPEIKVLIPLLKNFGNTLVAMVSNRQSQLGSQADWVLHTPVAIEAEPNNLAPTASTTAQMAMGDALATTLLAIKGFSSKDFAKFHPGGALGKQLYLRVSDLLTTHETPPIVNPDATLETLILEMTSKRMGATAVLDDQKKLIGIITDGDLRRMLTQKKQSNKNIRAKDILNRSPKTIVADTLAVEALQQMRQFSISQLIVLSENQQYLGMIHLHELLREGLI